MVELGQARAGLARELMKQLQSLAPHAPWTDSSTDRPTDRQTDALSARSIENPTPAQAEGMRRDVINREGDTQAN